MDLIKDNAELFSLLTFFLGLALGHWLALGRDKRKEFNSASFPIREWLLKEINDPSPYQKFPSMTELDAFTNKLIWFKRRSFMSAYAGQKSAREAVEKQDSYGSVFYTDKTEIIRELKKCFRYTKLK